MLLVGGGGGLKFLIHIGKKVESLRQSREPPQNRGVAETQRINFRIDAYARFAKYGELTTGRRRR